jgi:hypothetical protein
MSLGINEFYQKYLGKKLRTQYAWGAKLDNSVLALNCWSEELSVVDNKTRVLVLDTTNPSKMTNGHINPNYIERVSHIEMVKSGFKVYGVLISNGGACSNATKWNIKDLNTDSIFELTDLEIEDGVYTMTINLTSPIPIKEMVFDIENSISQIQNFPNGLETIKRAKSKGWELVGVNDEFATLSQKNMYMKVELTNGKFATTKDII